MENKARMIFGMLTVLVAVVVMVMVAIDILTPPPPTPNVILLLMDTVRADHVGCCSAERNGTYGADGLTPTLDSLAATGMAYPHCQAQACWTLPAMSTIYTGVSSRAHGANTGADCMTGISEEYTTITEMMKDAGYDTYGLFNAPVMNEPYGFHQGYDFIDANGCSVTVDAEYVVNTAIQWMDERDNEDGFFMSLHFFDAHYPYDPPDKYWEDLGLSKFEFPSAQSFIASFYNGEVTEQDFDILHALYCSEIHSMDAEIGRLLGELRARGLDENTIIIAVADHGEEFGEHGEIFHRDFFQETIHVPLIIAGPGVPNGLVVQNPVGQFDILPTIAFLVGTEAPEYVEGLIALPDLPSHIYVPSSGGLTGAQDLAVVRMQDAKAFWDPDDDSSVGFDLEEDPGETIPLAVPDVIIEQAQYYWTTPHTFIPMVVPNSEQRSALMRDLGYL